MRKLIGKLLVLDHEYNTQKQLAQKLSSFGLAYSFVDDNNEALQLLKSSHNNFDLLLVNCSESRNHDIAKLIRDEPKKFGFVNIIFYGDKKPNHLSAGVDYYILDVFSKDKLYDCISKFLIVSEVEVEVEVEEHDSLFDAFENYTKENKILMYQTIVNSMSQDVESLNASLVDNNRLGHKIKGTSEMIGAGDLAHLAKEFEVSHDILKINDLRDALIKEVLRVIKIANNNLEYLNNEK